MAGLLALVPDGCGPARVLGASAVASVFAAVASVPKTFRRVVLAMPVAAALALAVPKPLLELDFAGFGHALSEEVVAAVAELQALGVAEALLQTVGAAFRLVAAIEARVRVVVARVFALRIVLDAAPFAFARFLPRTHTTLKQ